MIGLRILAATVAIAAAFPFSLARSLPKRQATDMVPGEGLQDIIAVDTLGFSYQDLTVGALPHDCVFATPLIRPRDRSSSSKSSRRPSAQTLRYATLR